MCDKYSFIYEQISKRFDRNLILNFNNSELIVDVIRYDNIHKEIELLYSKCDKELNKNRIIDNVCNYYVNQYKDKTGKSLNDRRLRKLRTACKRSIKYLFDEGDYGRDDVPVDIDFLDDEGDDNELTLANFNDLNGGYLYRVIDFAKATVEESGLKKSDIDYILLVGCGSRIKRIRELLKEAFIKSELGSVYKSEEISCIGATIFA